LAFRFRVGNDFDSFGCVWDEIGGFKGVFGNFEKSGVSGILTIEVEKRSF
jgi:hypothetical protein